MYKIYNFYRQVTMRYNLYIIEDNLPDINFERHIIDEPSVALCQNTKLLDDLPQELNQNVLYIIDSKKITFRPIQTGIPSIICVGTPPENWLSSDMNILYTNDNISTSVLLNRVYSVLINLSEWKDSLQEVVDNKLPVVELAIRSSHLINNTIVAQGMDFRYIFTYAPKYKYPEKENANQHSEAITSKWVNRINNFSGQKIPKDLIEMLIRDPNYLNQADKTIPSLYYREKDLDNNHHQALFYNVRLEGITIARIYINEFNEPIKPSYHYYIYVLASYLRKILRQQYIGSAITNKNKDLLDNTDSLLSRIMVPERTLYHSLKKYSWEINDCYICVCFRLDTNINGELQAEVLARNIINNSNAYICRQKNNDILVVFNLSKLDLSAHEFIQSISPSLKVTKISTSASRAFTDYKNLYYYYRQASFALAHNEQQGTFNNIELFNDCMLDYLMKKALDHDIYETYIPDGLLNLLKIDNEKGTSQTHILKVYLDNERNITKTVKQLFMSKSTFIYRIKKIEDILGIQLDDAKKRLELQIALRLLEQEML